MNIGDVCEKADLTADTLRYYERIGLIPPVKRTPGGLRTYGDDDLLWIEYIKCMRGAGMTIEQLVKYVELFRQGDETIEARKALLREQRQQLVAKMAQLQRTLDMLDHKLAMYESGAMQVEQALVGTSKTVGESRRLGEVRNDSSSVG